MRYWGVIAAGIVWLGCPALPTFDGADVTCASDQDCEHLPGNFECLATSKLCVRVPPVVDAGDDGEVITGQPASLLGIVLNSDGDSLTTLWTQSAGSPVVIAAPDALSTSFVAPDFLGPDLTFQLQACDPAGTCTTDHVTFEIVEFFRTGLYVALPPLGDDLSGDGTTEAPFASVSRALEVGAPLVTVLNRFEVRVAEGTYVDHVVMRDGIDVVGQFSTDDWSVDPRLTTRIQLTTSLGLRWSDSLTYELGAQVRGLDLELVGGLAEDDQAVVSVETSGGDLAQVQIQAPTAPVTSVGIVVASGATASLSDVQVATGDTVDVDGVVYGLAAGSGAKVVATGLVVGGPSPNKRTRVGIHLLGATLVLTDSRVEFGEGPTLPTLATDESYGLLAIDGSVVTIDGGKIVAAAGYHTSAGLAVGTGSEAIVTGAILRGGDSFLAPDESATTVGAYVGDGRLEVYTSSVRGGSMTSGVLGSHMSVGIAAAVDATLLVERSQVEAGPGGSGIGVLLSGMTSAVIRESGINAQIGAPCLGALCVGVFVTGASGILRDPPRQPSAADPSCCDPTVHDVVIENSRVSGGRGTLQSIGLLATNANNLPPASVCVNASVIDPGDCSTGECIGISLEAEGDLTVQNSLVYGGKGRKTVGLFLMQGGGFTPIISNNYIHGGDPDVAVSRSTGILLGAGAVVGSSGAILLNNIIDAGTGLLRHGVEESSFGSDPEEFTNNNLYFVSVGAVSDSALYSNCDGSVCGVALRTLAEVNGKLVSNEQTTQQAGGNISDPDCLEDPSPLSGNPRIVPGSACENAGIERNKDCYICQTPWVDAAGSPRIATEWDGATCDPGAPFGGDGQPDIGPGEL